MAEKSAATKISDYFRKGRGKDKDKEENKEEGAESTASAFTKSIMGRAKKKSKNRGS